MTVSPAAESPRPARADRRGLSLLELLLVVVLLLSIGAIVLPSIDAINDESTWASESTRLRSVLERARVAAVDRGQPVLIQLEDDAMLTVRPWLGETEAPALVQSPLAGVDVGEAQLPLLLAVVLPDGQARMPAPLVFEGEGGRRGALQMDALTGRVLVVDPLPLMDEEVEPTVPIPAATSGSTTPTGSNTPTGSP